MVLGSKLPKHSTGLLPHFQHLSDIGMCVIVFEHMCDFSRSASNLPSADMFGDLFNYRCL